MLPVEKQTLLNSLTEEEKRLIKACVDADNGGQHFPSLLQGTISKFKELGLLTEQRRKALEGEQSLYPPFVTDSARELFE